MPASVVTFGPFALDTVERRLTRDGAPVIVQDKTLALLAALLERPGRLWPREELHARLWPGVFVSDDALFQAVRKARQALGDDARAPRWIETVGGRGYRFVGATGAPPVPNAAPSPSAAPSAPPPSVLDGVRCRPPDVEVLGREEERAAIRAALDAGARVVTLVGPGGVGKTTLARLVGAEAGDGGRFVDLAAAVDASGMLDALGEGLGADSGGPGAAEAAFRALPTAPGAVVVLDNAERCVAALAPLLVDWAPRARTTRFVVTSRRPLAIGAEHVVPVGPLPPAPAARLFRTRAAARGVVLAAEDRAQIDAIVQVVDALPLALELAASRVGLLGLDGLLERLREPLAVLRTTRADVPERHRSIGAALELSWGALEPTERSFLAGVCVFAGSFCVDDAERVVTGPGWRGPPALDLTQAILDASLVRPEPGGGERRFLPYVAVREFATERADPAALLAVRDRHLAWLAGLSDGLAVGQEPPPSAYRRLVPLLEDGVQALRHALDTGRPTEAARVALWLVPVMARRGAGLRAAELLDRIGPPDALVGERELGLRFLRAGLHARGTRPEAAAAHFEALVERARAAGRPDAEAAALLLWIESTISRNVAAAQPLLARARAVVPVSGSPAQRALLRGLEGQSRFHTGAAQEAEAEVRAALAELRALDRGWEVAQLLLVLAGFAYQRHRYAAAEPSVREALGILESAQATANVDRARTFLAGIWQGLGDVDRALALFEELRERAVRAGDAQREQHLVGSIGGALGLVGRIAEAAVAFEEALRLARQQDDPVQVAWAQLRLAGAAWRQGRMDPARAWLREAIEGFAAAGRPLLADAAYVELAQVELVDGKLAAAVAALEEADARFATLDRGHRRVLAAALHAEARARLGDADAIGEIAAAVETLRASWPTEGLARGLASLGMARLAHGDRAGAEAAYAEAERLRVAADDRDGNIARNVRRLRAAMG